MDKDNSAPASPQPSTQPEPQPEAPAPQPAKKKKRRMGKIGCALRLFALLLFAGAWLASLYWLAPADNSAIFYINGEVIPMSADEHIVARIANKNCRVKNNRTMTLVKSLSFLKSSGETDYIMDVEFEYLADWNAFSINQTGGEIVCSFKKLSLKKPVRYRIKSRSTTRGLLVGRESLERAESEFFADGGIFQAQMQNAALGGEYQKMAETEAKKSLASIMQKRVFPLLKIKPKGRKITVEFSDAPKPGKIVDIKALE